MYVVSYATNAVKFAVATVNDLPNVAIHVLAGLIRDCHLSAVGVDDYVIDGIYGTHVNIVLSLQK